LLETFGGFLWFLPRSYFSLLTSGFFFRCPNSPPLVSLFIINLTSINAYIIHRHGNQKKFMVGWSGSGSEASSETGLNGALAVDQVLR
jgi:hypothetical protein